VPKGTTERAAASSFAPTMAALLGLSLESFPDRPLFGADQMATLR
jgi:hypothetical protein